MARWLFRIATKTYMESTVVTHDDSSGTPLCSLILSNCCLQTNQMSSLSTVSAQFKHSRLALNQCETATQWHSLVIIIEASLRTVALTYSRQSLAYLCNCGLCWVTTLLMSTTQKLNNSRPKTEPWGIHSTRYMGPEYSVKEKQSGNWITHV